jgi:hypothetical protein
LAGDPAIEGYCVCWAGLECARCGAAPGRLCDPAAHDAHADPQRRAIDLCTCGHDRAAHVFSELTLEGATCIARTGMNDCGVNPTYCVCARFTPHPQPESSIAADLAAWNRHQRGCHACTTAPAAASLCLAGAALWQRAGLEVIPVPARPAPVPPPIPARGGYWPSAGAPARPHVLLTSALCRLVAEYLDAWTAGGPPEIVPVLADELRLRAHYLATLGGHDEPPATVTLLGVPR